MRILKMLRELTEVMQFSAAGWWLALFFGGYPYRGALIAAIVILVVHMALDITITIKSKSGG